MSFLKEKNKLLDTIKLLEPLALELANETNLLTKEKILKKYLQNLGDNKLMLRSRFDLKDFTGASVVIYSILACGQEKNVLGLKKKAGRQSEDKWKQLITDLLEVEHFYSPIGGIVGYYLQVIKLITKKSIKNKISDQALQIHQPPKFDLSIENDALRQSIRAGLESLPLIAEFFPVGGAADRLNLYDTITKKSVPAARLQFLGKSLFEILIRDVQALEYLYFQLFQNQVVIPIALMTSEEKNNHEEILKLLDENDFFNRPRDSFILFTQPMVPVIDQEGNWVMTEPMKYLKKPGGHGVIWKLARDMGVFDRLMELGKTKAIVRQINNPIGGTDIGLLALIGKGVIGKYSFGFSSCERIVGANEGMVVLLHRKNSSGHSYWVSNIEYTDFQSFNIVDQPKEIGSPYSMYPANTNILFVDLSKIKQALDNNPIPGMILNMKQEIKRVDAEGNENIIFSGRLESAMQNIADSFTTDCDDRGNPSNLQTLVTFQTRAKTMATTKKLYQEGAPLLETPEGALSVLLENQHELLTFCGLVVPPPRHEKKFIKEGPTFLFQYHPALGPCWSVIRQKLRGGELSLGAELILEIAEVDIENINLKGSLMIESENLLGSIQHQGCGKVTLRNIIIENKGIGSEISSSCWKNEIKREEAFSIILKGNSEFIAENITFTGDTTIIVPDGYRMIATQEKGQISYMKEKISEKRPLWSYSFDEKDSIILSKPELDL